MWVRIDFTQPMRYYSCATLDERAIPASDIGEQLQLEQAPRMTATKLKAKEFDEDSIPLHHIYCESLVCEHKPSTRDRLRGHQCCHYPLCKG